MFQILIVDDEPTALQAVELFLTDEAVSGTRIFTELSAEGAMTCFQQNDIDLLITDIEMQGMSGLDLIMWVREHYPRTQSIVLTCHAKFVYVQKALNLGAMQYILKPVQPEQLRAAVNQAKEICAQRSKNANLHNKLLTTYTTQYLQDVLTHSLSGSRERYTSRASHQGITQMVSGEWILILLHMEQWNDTVSKDDERLLCYALRNIAEELFFTDQREGYVLPWEGSDSVVLSRVTQKDNSKTEDFLTASCRRLIEMANTFLLADFSCYIGQPVTVESLASQMDQIELFYRQHPLRHNQVIQIAAMIPESSEEVPAQEKIRLDDIDWIDMLFAHKEEELTKDLIQKLEQQFLYGDETALLRDFQSNLQRSLFSELQQNHLQVNWLFTDPHSVQLFDQSLDSLDHFEEWLRFTLTKAGEALRQTRKSRTVVDNVKEYIATHIGEDLRRETIGNAMYLSPEYLSRLFHQKTGITLKDYIAQQRINTAKQLLSGTQMPISDIAMAVGYATQSSFSQAFRGIVGLTPMEYRKNTHR